MTNEFGPKKIETPFSRRIRLLRQQFLPIVVWSVALCTVLVLARRNTMHIDAVGVVELREITVAPLTDGTVHAMSVDLFDNVESGAVVALMDDTLVKAELITAEAELSQLRAQLTAERDRLQMEAAGLQIDDLNMRRRFILNEEEARLDYLDRVVQQETNKVALERLGILLERQKLLLQENIIDQTTYDDTRLSYEAVKTELAENETAIEVATRRVEEARLRREEHAQLTAQVDVPTLLQPLMKNINVQQARIQQISERRKLLALRAPLSGKVSRIFHRTGETVLSGDPLMSITDSQSERVLAYVDEQAAHSMQVGSGVEVSSRDRPKRIVTANILRVNSRIEEFPIRLRRNPLLPQWGLSILVGNIPAGVFYPGEVLNVRIMSPTTSKG